MQEHEIEVESPPAVENKLADFVTQQVAKYFPEKRDVFVLERFCLQKVVRDHFLELVRTNNPDISCFLRELGRLQSIQTQVHILFERKEYGDNAIQNLEYIKAMIYMSREDSDYENVRHVVRSFFLDIWRQAKNQNTKEQSLIYEESAKMVADLRPATLKFIKSFAAKFRKETREAGIILSGVKH